MQTRDVIVIGSSMGGIEALSALVARLPADLPAAVLVVQHVSEASPAILGDILGAKGTLAAVTAEDGMALERGRIHVAPPDRHLLVTPRGVRVVFGPRENRSRPAIDPLFRTAAVHCRSRVIGVVLTGLLSDGAAGLHAVARCGGTAVVQSPDDAAFPEMPTRALERVPRAHEVRIAEMGALLDRLSHEAAPVPPPVPEALAIEVRITERRMWIDEGSEMPGHPTNFTCPECSGALEGIDEEGRLRYRCRVGHAFSTDDLLVEKTQALEETLWVAMQTLVERADMLAALARNDRDRGRARTAMGFEERAIETRRHVDRLRELLASLAP